MDPQIFSGNSDRIKQLNRSNILKIIHKIGPISKAELSTNSKYI